MSQNIMVVDSIYNQFDLSWVCQRMRYAPNDNFFSRENCDQPSSSLGAPFSGLGGGLIG